MGIEEAGKQGSWKIYKDLDGQHLLGYKGIQHPMDETQIIPAIKSWVNSGIEWLQKQENVPVEEVIKFLQTIINFTEPEKGYFYAPVIPGNPSIGKFTKYGQKLLEERSNESTDKESS